jgi:hypothetical protein
MVMKGKFSWVTSSHLSQPMGQVALVVYTSIKLAIVNQHPPVHHEGWMVSGQKTVFCWAPVA